MPSILKIEYLDMRGSVRSDLSDIFLPISQLLSRKISHFTFVQPFEIRELRRIDFKNSILVDGFPSVGLVSSIIANYLTTLLRLEYVGYIDSPFFPALTLIRNSLPMAPARLYASGDAMPGDKQIALFTSELQPSQNIVKPLGEMLINWAIQNKCKLILSVGGLVIEREVDNNNINAEDADQISVYGIASNSKAAKYLELTDVEPFIEGIITGTSGILLREGKKRGFDVVVLLTEARQEIADARAAALLMAAIDQMVLKMNLDIVPLCKEAEKMEVRISKLSHQAVLKAKDETPQPIIGYR